MQSRRDLSTVTDVTVPERVTGLDGKSRPSPRPAVSLRCQLCGAPAGHVDHIVPVRSGGSDQPDNLRALCVACNLRRGAG